MHETFPKPPRGTYIRERRQRKLDADAYEKREKAKVRARDRKCRWPYCTCSKLNLPLEVAHVVAKSLGGSSDADNMLLLCIEKHQGRPSLHSGDLEVRPHFTTKGTNGTCDFAVLRDDGRWDVVASERMIGVPTTKGA
jgi:hypothetical protein